MRISDWSSDVCSADLNHDYLANADCRVETYFVTPPLKPELGLRVTFLPLFYNDIRTRLQGLRIDALLCMVAPPGDAGCCSFGVAVDFAAELWRDLPVRIAHIHPHMPRTTGDAGHPYTALTAYVAGEQELYSHPTPPPPPCQHPR